MKTETLCVRTGFGWVQLSAQDGALVAVDMVPLACPTRSRHPVLLRARQQLLDYCQSARNGFDLPLRMAGTSFQQKVWEALQAIPCGEVRSYGDLARQLKSSPRAIGGACRANPLPIIVPCHRVVSRQGLGGYSGETAGHQIDIKKRLLRHEGLEIDASGHIL